MDSGHWKNYTDLSELEIPKNQGILLECISNLVANELYREDGTLNDLKETKEKRIGRSTQTEQFYDTSCNCYK